ncbi:rCG58944 [Rattus norvegicus]|uniref:RCG58944 n=1 Tax=Rattus norvegicus TaxID=10116 RepID=A6KQ72_RAT|nr:rCG58944 [Rattus norvegicus]
MRWCDEEPVPGRSLERSHKGRPRGGVPPAWTALRVMPRCPSSELRAFGEVQPLPTLTTHLPSWPGQNPPPGAFICPVPFSTHSSSMLIPQH